MQQGAELVPGVRIGDILADKYRIERLLGAGGMGVVVAAYHIHLDERVAIKFLLPEALKNPEIIARFAREARSAVKIKSEHVARIIDVGTLPSASPYMVMEYLDGCDLSTWLQQRGALSVEQTVEFALQACEAIAEAHGLGIIHRDLKPANLFCIRRSDGIESIKVLDFGISKAKKTDDGAKDAQLTSTSAVFGSPLYMSPEQMLSSRDVDSRADIWAIGTILYELVTGRSPFDGETLPEVYARISSQPPPPLRDRRPDVPAGIEAIILKCLEKDRNQRYSNVAELARALAPFGPKRTRALVDRIVRIIQEAGLSASATALPPSSDQVTQLSGAGTSAAWGQTAPAPKSGSARMVLVVLVPICLIVATAAGFFVSRTSTGPFRQPTANVESSFVPAKSSEQLSAAPAVPTVAIASSRLAVPITSAVVATSTAAIPATPAVTAGVARGAPSGSKAGWSVARATLSVGKATASAEPPRVPARVDEDYLKHQY